METIKSKTVYLITFILILSFLPKTSRGQTIPVEAELTQLIHDAIESSQSVEIELNKARAAENNRKKAYQTYLPTLSFTGSYTHLNDDITFPSNLESLLIESQKLIIKEQLGMGFNDPFPPSIPLEEVAPLQTQNILKTTLEADMIVFTGMKAPNLAKASEHQQKAHEALSRKEETQVIQETIKAYKSLALIHQSATVLDNSELRLEEQRRYVNKAVDQGLATELETARIDLVEQQLQEKRIELNAQKSLAIAFLHQLTGHPKSKLKQLTPELHYWNTDVQYFTAKQRPEMVALTEAERATEFKKKSVYSSYLPQIKIFGRKELYEEDLSLLDPKWMAGVGLRWTLFDGLKRSRDVQNAKIEVKNIELRKDLIEEQLDLNLTKAFLALDQANQKIEVAEQQMKTSEKAYNISKKQHEVGLISQKDYLEAENNLQQSELAYSQAIYNQNLAVVDYLIAGGTLSQAIAPTPELNN